MKPFALKNILFIGPVIGLVGLATGCKTTQETTVSDEPPAQQIDAPDDSPGPFEVAAQWLDSEAETSDAVRELTDQWADAHVERMRRTADNYEALLVSGDEPDAILLTLRHTQSGWEVVTSEIVASDWGWPVR